MRCIKVGAAVLNQTPLDWQGNRANILAAIRSARDQRVSVLCLPELCITGYGCEDAFHGASVREISWKILQELLPETTGMVVSLGLPISHRNALFNAACLVVDGKIEGFVAKQNLPGDGIHYEPRWFKPWPHGVVSQLRRGDRAYPIGDLYFDLEGIRLGFEICEDAWVADRPGADLAAKGVDLVLNPSASHFAFGKLEVRKRLVLEGSRAFGVSYVYTNLLGNEAGRIIYDGGAVIASGGRLLALGPRFSFEPMHLTAAVIDVDSTRMAQSRNVSLQPEVSATNDHSVQVSFEIPEHPPETSSPHPPHWESAAHHKEEEFSRAVALGLFDYLRKSRAHGFVVSLSGGADSSAVSALVALMVRLAARELGLAGLQQRLAHIPALAGARSGGEVLEALLSCVYQSTRNSSEVTRSAAKTVARALGARFFEFGIDELVDRYVELGAGCIGRPLTWEQDDLALQNIQARARAPGVWLLANLKRSLLLVTSNRSEAAVGYATMDGDTAGGLSPIGGIDKAFLKRWLSWLETEGPEGLGPIPELSVVNVQAPTAELKPPEFGQTDEGDLMPYPLLDAVERAAIRDKHDPLATLRLMREGFPEYGEADLRRWISSFYRRWCSNQWKRERYAPSFHLDDENLDPKTWCRFPILSGGFELELAALETKGPPPEPISS